MKYFITFLFMILFYPSRASLIKSPICEVTETKVSILNRNDFVVKNDECYSKTGNSPFLLTYLKRKNQQVLLSKKYNEFNYEKPKLLAVSVHRSISKPPILIMLYGQYTCCYPKPEGTYYDVKLFKILQNKDKFSIVDISQILGENSSGLDGQDSETNRRSYSFKNISSVEEWLQKNY